MKDLPCLFDNVFSPRLNEGPSKVTSLAEAVREHVKPGMTIHLGSDACALMSQLLRQFWGKAPGFTLVLGQIEELALNLLHAGLAQKAVTSICANLNPTPGPSRVVQRALKGGTLAMENWSLYTITQRLMAGALGLPFMPTRSLAGSSMDKENLEAFRLVDNPFGDGQVGVIPALQPDVSLIHGLAADPAGNTIPVFGDGEAVWGALASKDGVIVSVERIVSTDFIREHAALVKIPGYTVKAVCLAPFGAHPQSLSNRWVRGVDSYAEDREFVLEHRRASREEDALNQWIQEWVLGTASHEGYLQKLGAERLATVKDRASRTSWEKEVTSLLRDPPQEANATETMVVAASRRIKETVKARGYKVLLSGIGTGGLAPALAYYLLREEGYDLELMIGTGPFGFLPRVANLDSAHHLGTSKMVTETLNIYGVFLSGPASPSIGTLGAAQIDRFGNVNSTYLPDGTFLTGSGGGNDIAAGAAEALVIAPQSPSRFVEQVSYITVPGERIRTLVSSMGVMEKLGDEPEFVLTAYFPRAGLSKDEAIAEVKKNCGWDLRVASTVREEPPPATEELTILRALDARREFLD